MVSWLSLLSETLIAILSLYFLISLPSDFYLGFSELSYSKNLETRSGDLKTTVGFLQISRISIYEVETSY